MLEILKSLDTEVIAGGLVGLTMVGLVVRNAVIGWYEARAKINENSKSMSPMGSIVTAMSLTWNKDQIERFLQVHEAISESLELLGRAAENIAKTQSDQFQQLTKSKLDDILKRLEEAEHAKPRTRGN